MYRLCTALDVCEYSNCESNNARLIEPSGVFRSSELLEIDEMLGKKYELLQKLKRLDYSSPCKASSYLEINFQLENFLITRIYSNRSQTFDLLVNIRIIRITSNY